MRSIIYSLAWKEWHEHKWKLAAIVAIMWSVTLPAIYYSEDDPLGVAAGMLMLCVVLLSLFVGLGAAANERSRGTVAFLQALPVPIWRVALWKLFFGLATVMVPMLLTVGLFSVCGRLLGLGTERSVPFFQTGNWYLSQTAILGMFGGSLFIWSAAAGVNRRDEVSAGAVGLAIMLGWITLLVLLIEKTAFFGNSLQWKVVALSTAPAGPALDDMFLSGDWERFYLRTALGVATVTHIALAAWYIGRFGRVAIREVRSPQQAERQAGLSDWLAPPRRSWFSAIVWKQFRESGPIVLAGLAGVAGIVALIVLPDMQRYKTTDVAAVIGAVTITLGFAVALVCGVGIFLNDLTPRIDTFWRSRPIQPDAWFWTKFLSGYAVFFVSFSLPLLAVAFIAWEDISKEFVAGDFQNKMMTAMLVPPTVYASAVAMTCLVRHAVYAAILSIPLMYTGLAIVWVSLQVAAVLGLVARPASGFVEPSLNAFAIGMTISLVVSTLVAWLAVRHDWGWKIP